jgi:hypothetical protein
LSRVDVAATSFRATSLPRPFDVDPLEENAVLLKENKTLQETVLAQKHAFEKLFTAGQIKKLMKPDNQTVHWSANDIPERELKNLSIFAMSQLSPTGTFHLKNLDIKV